MRSTPRRAVCAKPILIPAASGGTGVLRHLSGPRTRVPAHQPDPTAQRALALGTVLATPSRPQAPSGAATETGDAVGGAHRPLDQLVAIPVRHCFDLLDVS
ncbi:hypothetical protein [Streptomyces chartreusis]|uniref:hypothetical protein n=1 Tax=Streptomyces chartreusis TaxID=1969 RepID=UPI002E18A020